MIWKENGGPRLAPPSRRGFGTRLIEASAAQIGGSVHFDYTPEGLELRLEIAGDAAAGAPH